MLDGLSDEIAIPNRHVEQGPHTAESGERLNDRISETGNTLRNLSNEDEGRTESEFADGQNLALAYRLVSRMESLSEILGRTGKLIYYMQQLGSIRRQWNDIPGSGV